MFSLTLYKKLKQRDSKNCNKREIILIWMLLKLETLQILRLYAKKFSTSNSSAIIFLKLFLSENVLLTFKMIVKNVSGQKTVPEKTVPDKTVLNCKIVYDKTVPDKTVPKTRQISPRQNSPKLLQILTQRIN